MFSALSKPFRHLLAWMTPVIVSFHSGFSDPLHARRQIVSKQRNYSDIAHHRSCTHSKGTVSTWDESASSSTRRSFPTKFRSPWSSERATLWTHPTECDFRPRSTAYIQTPRCCKPCTHLNTGPAASDLLDPVDAPHCHNTQTPWTKTAKGFHHYVDRRSASSST